VPRNPEETKRRIMAAATAEFATHGIAGARVDRIAEQSASSKERIYAYFGNKEELFDAVFSQSIQATLDTVHFDAGDLPGYAGRMFDHFTDNPDGLRLSTWYRLERPEGIALPSVTAANHSRLKALTDAQRAGTLPGHFNPVQLLALIQSVATAWATMNPEFAGSARKVSRREQRRSVVEGVARLIGEQGDDHQASLKP
jgi:AcrR family transcriptional regulator